MGSRVMLMCLFAGSILPAPELFVDDDDGDDIFGEDVDVNAEDNRSLSSGGRFRLGLGRCLKVVTLWT